MTVKDHIGCARNSCCEDLPPPPAPTHTRTERRQVTRFSSTDGSGCLPAGNAGNESVMMFRFRLRYSLPPGPVGRRLNRIQVKRRWSVLDKSRLGRQQLVQCGIMLIRIHNFQSDFASFTAGLVAYIGSARVVSVGRMDNGVFRDLTVTERSAEIYRTNCRFGRLR